MRVTPAALSHQVKILEDRLGFALFHRLPRGLALTDEGTAMLPVLSECFDRIALLLERMNARRPQDIVTLGVVGTFALTWLIPRMEDFSASYPEIDLRLTTNNNRVDIAEEGLDYAIRFGDGAWNSTEADLIFSAPFTALCSPKVAARLREPKDLLQERLLRSYRVVDWPAWFEVAGLEAPPIRGPIFDSSRLMVDAAMADYGVALAPLRMFEAELRAGHLCRPFPIEVDFGGYYLTRLKSRPVTQSMNAFRGWLLQQAKLPPAEEVSDTVAPTSAGIVSSPAEG